MNSLADQMNKEMINETKWNNYKK